MQKSNMLEVRNKTSKSARGCPLDPNSSIRLSDSVEHLKNNTHWIKRKAKKKKKKKKVKITHN